MQFARGGRTQYFVSNATPPLPDGGGGGHGSNGSAMGGHSNMGGHSAMGEHSSARGLFRGGIIQRIRDRRAGRLAARMGH